MNRERAKELLPIIQAFVDGKDIEVKGSVTWMSIKSPNFGINSEYRIKPEPFECWVVKSAIPNSWQHYGFDSQEDAENFNSNKAIHMGEIE